MPEKKEGSWDGMVGCAVVLIVLFMLCALLKGCIWPF